MVKDEYGIEVGVVVEEIFHREDHGTTLTFKIMLFGKNRTELIDKVEYEGETQDSGGSQH